VPGSTYVLFDVNAAEAPVLPLLLPAVKLIIFFLATSCKLGISSTIKRSLLSFSAVFAYNYISDGSSLPRLWIMPETVSYLPVPIC